MTRVGNLLTAVTFRWHDHAAAVGLQQIHIRSPYDLRWLGQVNLMDNRQGFRRTRVDNRVILMYCGEDCFTGVNQLFQLGVCNIWPTIMVPVSDKRVETGYCESWARISFIGRLRSTFTASPSPAWRSSCGMYWPGLCSSFSIPDTFAVDFRFNVWVSGRSAHAYRQDARDVADG